MEHWKDVPGFEGLYQVSDQGRVRNVKRGKVLKPRTTPNGYQNVVIYRNGEPKALGVHRLVALAFIPNPGDKPEVNHRNGVKTDNHLTNLEWSTRSENQRHRYDVLGKRQTNGKPVLCEETGETFATATAAAEALKLNRSAVTMCCLGHRKTTNNLHFKFKEELNYVY